MRIFTAILGLIVLSIVSCKINTSMIRSDETIIYLVRHAEKADDGTRNPPLTIKGQARATKLADILKEKGISKIYSTDFTRTKQTAMPLAGLLGLEVDIYDYSKLGELAKEVKLMKGKAMLISGHSNTTPTLTNEILGDEKYQQLSEKEYGKLFKVIISKNGMTSEVTNY